VSSTNTGGGPVQPSAVARTRLRPLGVGEVAVTGGFWAERMDRNREGTIPYGFGQLERAGNLDNLRAAAGQHGEYRAGADSGGLTFAFVDSDVYKWLEAVGWELGRRPEPDGPERQRLVEAADEAIALVAAAQRPDGYLNSYVQLRRGGEPYGDLEWGHELYCVGHLIQAAVAWHRSVGDDRLLAIAVRAADHADHALGTAGKEGVDGHPGVEMALVELGRVTGERRYVALAGLLLERRGRGLLGPGRFGPAYWQDHEPVREASTVAGHVVRQLYLDCGAVDVAVECDDRSLLDSVLCRWRDLTRTRTYLTGGMGSRHLDEAFGDPFELPPDRAYAETCGAIAGVMLAWRLLLATGESRYADAIERATFNGVLAGISLHGDRFSYVNPLQRRTRRVPEQHADGGRAPWFPCACCPPNLMRMLSSWPHYLATAGDSGVQLHQYATANVRADVAGGPVELAVETDYPWDGRVTIHIVRTPGSTWELSLRIPAWCRSATLTDAAGTRPVPTGRGVTTVEAEWAAGDSVVLDLDMPVRVVEPDPRVDAVRGCLAVERGPLVYCVESADLPPGMELEDLRWDRTRDAAPVGRDGLGPTLIGVEVPVVHREWTAGGFTVAAVPYYTWGNRDDGGMRVWVPYGP